jgi:S-adenosylmethionine:tRNA ribosyltransferase-isomerase
VADPRSIRIQEYDYPLPDDRIAQFPLEQRDQSRLLILKDSCISEDTFTSLSTHIAPESLMIFNETRVIHARLVFQKSSGSRIEIFCLDPMEPADIQLAFQQTGGCTWKCLVGNAKRWKGSALSMELKIDDSTVVLSAQLTGRTEEAFMVHFSWSPEEISFGRILEVFGKMPLPPYINRDAQESDEQRYQTLFARNDGSVAAPTAGLHFSKEVINSLKAKKIETANITLHVGAGTFKPVSSETIGNHAMHAEQVYVPLQVIEKLLEYTGKNITLVGTTTVRTIESLYWQGVKWLRNKPDYPLMQVNQWDPYQAENLTGITANESLECILEILKEKKCDHLRGTTSLMIASGYRFNFPSAIITNFHQPKSTLLLLVSAFAGPSWREAYDYALAKDFRFLSYGDSCLFFRSDLPPEKPSDF